MFDTIQQQSVKSVSLHKNIFSEIPWQQLSVDTTILKLETLSVTMLLNQNILGQIQIIFDMLQSQHQEYFQHTWY